jgi:hypothetical protein
VGNLAEEDARGRDDDDDRCRAAQSTKTKTTPRRHIGIAIVNKDVESVPQHQRPLQQWEGAQWATVAFRDDADVPDSTMVDGSAANVGRGARRYWIPLALSRSHLLLMPDHGNNGCRNVDGNNVDGRMEDDHLSERKVKYYLCHVLMALDSLHTAA